MNHPSTIHGDGQANGDCWRSQLSARLYAAVLSDVLDDLGYRQQAFRIPVRPLDDDRTLVGFARTGVYREVYHVDAAENPYELEIALVDALAPFDVVVLACGGSTRIAPWGALLTTASRARGAAGCVTDGSVRDIKAIRKLGFPVYHAGIAPLDSKGRGKVAEIDAPVICAGVHVAPGDLVVGDADGVIVLPRGVEAAALTGRSRRSMWKTGRANRCFVVHGLPMCSPNIMCCDERIGQSDRAIALDRNQRPCLKP